MIYPFILFIILYLVVVDCQCLPTRKYFGFEGWVFEPSRLCQYILASVGLFTIFPPIFVPLQNKIQQYNINIILPSLYLII